MKKEKRYILRNGEYYLSDLTWNCTEGQLTNFAMDREYKKYYDDIDTALEDLKLIYIETGLMLKVEEYETKDN